jgi:hypothetical protein
MIRPLAAALCLLALPASAQDAPRIPSHCNALAQAPATVLPAAWAPEVAQDHVLIRYLHHASLAILTHDGTLAVTDYTGLIGRADVVPDVATMNNAHHTHWTAAPDPRIPHVLAGWPGADGQPADHRLDLGTMLVRNVTTDTRDLPVRGRGAVHRPSGPPAPDPFGRPICRHRAGRYPDGAGGRRLYPAA